MKKGVKAILLFGTFVVSFAKELFCIITEKEDK